MESPRFACIVIFFEVVDDDRHGLHVKKLGETKVRDLKQGQVET